MAADIVRPENTATSAFRSHFWSQLRSPLPAYMEVHNPTPTVRDLCERDCPDSHRHGSPPLQVPEIENHVGISYLAEEEEIVDMLRLLISPTVGVSEAV